MKYAAKGAALVDFGMRRAPGPVAPLRAARGAQMAGFAATSNLSAARQLKFRSSGTMAHSYIQAHENEEKAFLDFSRLYGDQTILLVDTYDCREGIRKAARAAAALEGESGVRIKGIRIDSGDLEELSKYARQYFDEQQLAYLHIFVSGSLDEYAIRDLLENNAPIDGFGVGTRLAVSRHVPATDIAYKLIRYSDRGVSKDSPGKETLPHRKSIVRHEGEGGTFAGDTIQRYPVDGDLLTGFAGPEGMETIRERINTQLDSFDSSVLRIRKPADYAVDFRM